MATKILRLLQLAVYLIITSQLLFYLIILTEAMKKISLENFIELRKVVDGLMSIRFRLVYYTGLILTLTVVVASILTADPIFIMSSCIALICLITDVAIAMKGNIPINTMISNHTPGDLTKDWSALRLQWLKLINIRGAFIVIGMLAQITGLLWERL